MIRGYIKRDRKGKFKQVRKRAGLSPKLERRIQVVALGVLLGVVAGISLDVGTREHVIVKEVKAEEVVVDLPEPLKEVQIEVVYNWDKETVERKIDEAFPNVPIMKKVAWCESRYKIDAFNPTNNSDDKGLFQISTKYHGHRTKDLGLDMNDPIDNIAYAKILYDESGLAPWIWSKPCWNR